MIQLVGKSFAGNVPIPLVPDGPHSPQEHLPVNLTEMPVLLLQLLLAVVTPKRPRRLEVVHSLEI